MGSLFVLDVLGEPKPWQVFIRRGAPSIGYLAYKAYQLNIQAKVKEHWRGRPPLEETPLEIRLKFFRDYPNRLPKKPELYQQRVIEALCRKPDVDNLVKGAIDGIKGKLLGPGEVAAGGLPHDPLAPTSLSFQNQIKVRFSYVQNREVLLAKSGLPKEKH